MSETDNMSRARAARWRRLAPLAVLLIGLALVLAFDLDRFLSFGALREHNELLHDLVARHGVLAAGLFVVLYAVVVAFSVPGGAVLTIAGGFLFGTWLGALLAVIGATIGAIGVFLAARTALGDALRARAGPAIRRMERGFRENALSYMLVLRLIPIFPFWLVNLVPAFLGVPLRVYAIGTLLGIIPGTVVYASVGSGLDTLFAAGQTPDLGIIFEPSILGPLFGLAALALIPVLYQRWKERRGRPPSELP